MRACTIVGRCSLLQPQVCICCSVYFLKSIIKETIQIAALDSVISFGRPLLFIQPVFLSFLLNLQSCLWSVLNQQQIYLAEYFQNKLVETIQFMEVLNLKDSVEKDSFFRKLPNLAEQLPRQIVLKKV